MTTDAHDQFRTDRFAQRLDGVDADGMLRGRAIVAKTGVYQYSDGQSTWGEYVPDSTLRDPDWIASLRIAPLTLDHPAEPVTADNVAQLGVGAIGDSVVFADGRNVAPARIMRADAVAAVQGGIVELSCGYWCQVSDKAGEFNGQAYSRIQTKRRANHVAIVPDGRHGSSVRLLLDAAAKTADSEFARGATMADPIKTDAAADKCDKLQGKLDEMTKELDAFKLKSKGDAQTPVDPSDADKARADKLTADAFAAGKARAALEARAIATCAKDFACDGKDDRSLRLAMLDSLGVKVPADKATDDSYIAARLDAETDARSKTTASAQIGAGLTQTDKADPNANVAPHLLAIAEMQARQRGEIA